MATIHKIDGVYRHDNNSTIWHTVHISKRKNDIECAWLILKIYKTYGTLHIMFMPLTSILAASQMQ